MSEALALRERCHHAGRTRGNALRPLDYNVDFKSDFLWNLGEDRLGEK
jgi:hypothetical protein